MADRAEVDLEITHDNIFWLVTHPPVSVLIILLP